MYYVWFLSGTCRLFVIELSSSLRLTWVTCIRTVPAPCCFGCDALEYFRNDLFIPSFQHIRLFIFWWGLVPRRISLRVNVTTVSVLVPCPLSRIVLCFHFPFFVCFVCNLSLMNEDFVHCMQWTWPMCMKASKEKGVGCDIVSRFVYYLGWDSDSQNWPYE